jgi:hypothetical protein
MTLTMNHREFTYMCEKWGFKKTRTSSNAHQIMEHPSGKQITLRKAGAINDDTARQAADICGVSINAFMQGPPQEQKTTKRRKVGSAHTAILTYLVDHGDFVSEKGSAIQDLAEKLDQPVANVGYNIGKMIDRGEIIVDRRNFKRRAFVISLKPKNAPTEETPPIEGGTVTTPLPDIFEQADAQHVANLLFNRVVDIVMTGSAERNERKIAELESRLGEQVAYSNVARDKLRDTQMENADLRTRVRELTEQVSRLKDQMAKMDRAAPLSREVKNELALLNARRPK